jgi:hypothetical protein
MSQIEALTAGLSLIKIIDYPHRALQTILFSDHDMPPDKMYKITPEMASGVRADNLRYAGPTAKVFENFQKREFTAEASLGPRPKFVNAAAESGALNGTLAIRQAL